MSIAVYRWAAPEVNIHHHHHHHVQEGLGLIPVNIPVNIHLAI